MLPSKKSIRKMSTQPFPGWVLSFVKNADDYCGSLIMFSIKIIEHKKYLVGKGINADGKFLSVISKEGDILTLLENGRWSVACINQHISSNATVFNGACVYKFFNDDDKEGRSVYNTLCSHILSRKEKLKITEMRIPSKGEIVRTEIAHAGEIVIVPCDSLRLNDVLGNKLLLPRETWSDNPLPLLRTTIAPEKPEQRERLLNALTEIADTDPLLRYEVDAVTHEIILSFLGRVQLEIISDLLVEKYQLNTTAKEPTVIYMERPLKAVSHTIHIEVPPNPFWASIGLSVTPLPLGTGVQYESKVSVGYLNQSFQNAVLDGIRYGLEQGVYGWKVTDCKICFKYGLYYSPVSTPADFRMLAPIVLEQVLKKAGTELLEPYLSFKIYAPQEYLSRAYNDAPKYCANIVDTQLKNNEVILSGEIPARCIQEYRSDLTFFTNRT